MTPSMYQLRYMKYLLAIQITETLRKLWWQRASLRFFKWCTNLLSISRPAQLKGEKPFPSDKLGITSIMCRARILVVNFALQRLQTPQTGIDKASDSVLCWTSMNPSSKLFQNTDLGSPHPYKYCEWWSGPGGSDKSSPTSNPKRYAKVLSFCKWQIV